MDLRYYETGENEKPLDRIVQDGGFVGIFRRIGCIGDSLSSGEFESMMDGQRGWHDMYEYSWGQYIARDCGTKVINFSRGGMTAKEMAMDYYSVCRLYNTDSLCQAYIIALGANDLKDNGKGIALGEIGDIDIKDWHNNKDTFAGWYGQIIQRIKEKQPLARFFLMTMPNQEDGNLKELRDGMQKLLYEMAEIFDYTYVLDLRKYAPVYTNEFNKRYYLGGHMAPTGYMLTAKMVESYIDFLIRKYPEDFKQVPFMDTVWFNETEKM